MTMLQGTMHSQKMPEHRGLLSTVQTDASPAGCVADVRPLGQAKVSKYFWHSKSNKEKTKNEKQKEREKNNK